MKEQAHRYFFLNKKGAEHVTGPGQVLNKTNDVCVPQRARDATSEFAVSKEQLMLHTA